MGLCVAISDCERVYVTVCVAVHDGSVQGCVWLLCMLAAHGCFAWLLCGAAVRGCRAWLLCVRLPAACGNVAPVCGRVWLCAVVHRRWDMRWEAANQIKKSAKGRILKKLG